MWWGQTGKVDNKTNKELQNFLFKLLQDRNATAAKTALDVIVKLYQKKVRAFHLVWQSIIETLQLRVDAD